MTRPFWQRIDHVARQLMPLALTALLVIAGAVPYHIPGLARVMPVLPLMAVYHWTVYRPDVMPPWAIFLVGLMHDALTGVPLGTSGLVLLMVYGVMLTQRDFFVGKSFAILWMGFALVAAGALILGWLAVSAFHVRLVGPAPAFYQYLLTVGTYPVLAWVFMRWQRIFLEQA
jgi:rod shape-determining protein MreD